MQLSPLRDRWVRATCVVVAFGIGAAGACSIQDSEDFAPKPAGSGAAAATGTGTGGGELSTSSGETAAGTGAAGAGGAGTTGTGGGVEVASTPGTVACGNDVCEVSLGEVCCPDANPPQCSDTSCDRVLPMGSNPPSVLGCDDSADCSGGEVCCVTFAQGAQIYLCAAQADCVGFESCIPSGTCGDGLVCVDNADELTGAECIGDGAAVSCGAAECSGADVCCNDKTPTCAQPGIACTQAFECDTPSDCGPLGSCCLGAAGGSMCSFGHCDGLELCEKDADCGATACLEDAGLGLPSGYKVCN